MSIKTVRETLVKSGDKCFVVKKGKKYVGITNGEISIKDSAWDAVAFESGAEAENFVNVAAVDTRNAKKLGRNLGVCPIEKP